MATVWILADDRAGNVNQLLGIAEQLKTDFERIDIRYTGWVRLPNWLRGRTLLGLTEASKKNLTPPWPDVVLSAGRRSFPVARYIRKKSKKHTLIVQLMNPGSTGFYEAALVVLPMHDSFTKKAANVMRVVGAAHRITPARLKVERAKWEHVFSKYPHKRIAVIVGGATKDKPFTLQMAQDLIEAVKRLKPKSLLVTTSRRTPAAVVDFLQRELPTPHFFYRYGDKTENPYFGLLACADEIVVSGDSISMCSECCGTGLPVYIFAPDDMMSPKHKRFHTSLYADGYAVPLEAAAHTPCGALNPARDIAERIAELIDDA